MPKCKLCGTFQASVCQVDTSYTVEISQETLDAVEMQKNFNNVVRRAKNLSRPVEAPTARKLTLDEMTIP